jgi:hypothetical protein
LLRGWLVHRSAPSSFGALAVATHSQSLSRSRVVNGSDSSEDPEPLRQIQGTDESESRSPVSSGRWFGGRGSGHEANLLRPSRLQPAGHGRLDWARDGLRLPVRAEWRLEHYFGKDGELLGFVTLTQRLAIEAQSRLVFPCWMSS